jgi:hypothetical protein
MAISWKLKEVNKRLALRKILDMGSLRPDDLSLRHFLRGGSDFHFAPPAAAQNERKME